MSAQRWSVFAVVVAAIELGDGWRKGGTLMKSLATFLVLLLVSSFSLPCRAQNAAAPKTIKPAETKARLVCVTAKWAVWETSKLDERTKWHRVSRYDYALYRQRLTEAEAVLIYTVSCGPGGMRGTVTDDGTVLLDIMGDLSWHTPGKAEVDEPALRPNLYLLALYPDGALTYQDKGSMKPRTVAFIPFKDHRLNLEASISILTAEEENWGQWHFPLGHFAPRSFVRHENTLALILFHKNGAKHMPKDGWKSSLYVFDLKTKKHRTVPLGIGLDEVFHAMGFDGDMLTTYHRAFDARTGELVGPRDQPEFNPENGGITWKISAVRHRFGYVISHQELYATDLSTKTRQAIKLSAVPNDGPVALTEKGIILWNGKTWATIPWLKEWPEKK
jgi:hypothetical protein